ncbi:MAG TPA: DNA translocase FtsK 4TM domain-containing protein [Candidatus Saccharimonadales bacterium]|nr:DNA translocase FtsK 4TM domain-containing protein [Candidatus Saccharimonadales bacterium]
MAKRKQTRKKAAPEPRELSPFWLLTGAVLLFVLALFILLGGFGTGGPLPKTLFNGAYATFGWAAYLLPAILVYWGVYKFNAENHRMPIARLASTIAIAIFTASWFFTMSAVKQTNGSFSDGHGGAVGQLFGGMALSALDKFPASIMFIVFITLSVFFALSISPLVLKNLIKLFTRPKSEDTDLRQLKAKAESSGFKLNEGVPVEHSQGLRDKPLRLSSLKNSAEKVAPTDSQEALTIASDPNWKFPDVNLLDQKQDKADAGDVNGNAQAIRDTFANFNIDVEMEGANVGPRVTQYTMKPPTGVKLTKITALENNLALDLAAHAIRIEAPIPGKRAVGIEVPNVKSAIVRLSSIVQARDWSDLKGPLGFAIGKDISGKPVVADLAKMPHLLVAGQTGSGKSVMINAILTSLLYRNSPSDLKLILVDPKQVELTPYNDIPHLLTPVINEPEKCISALKWAVAEMERRLRTMAEVGKRNIAEYNNLKKEEGMPYIVIVIDELADLMMMAARDVEALIVRLAQKARAAGIHLVLATQRPSVDVITGLIKANVPARIAFTVASQVDSRTIIDQMGAEKLLGMGDMLLLTSDMPKPKRVQGAFISDEETGKVTDFIRMQRPPEYDDEIISQPVQLNGKGGVVADVGGNDADDDMWRDAVQVVIEGRKASTSLLQRRLRIGYGRAARLIETMEEQGIVGPADGARPREVLVNSLDEVLGGAGDTEAAPERVQL